MLENFDLLSVFQGVATLADSDPAIMVTRIVLIGLGCLLIYLGHKGVLEGLLMIPMGLGMVAINSGVLFLPSGEHGTLFLNPLIDSETEAIEWMSTLQIDWLQPVYSFTFSNGLIACMVFMGIGTLLDVGYVMARPFTSMVIALFAELGTIIIFPLAILAGLSLNDAAATATIGGADGPMILFASLILSDTLFVPITVVAYLYLGLTYGGYPYLIRLMVPKKLRMIRMPPEKKRDIGSAQKMVFAVVTCILLCLLFPVAAPLIMSLFLGVLVRESGIARFRDLLEGPVLYGATFFLGLLLGTLVEANTILDPQVLILLVLGILALLFSGIGGILGGYVLYFATGGKFNPVIGIAGVSCIPTTAKVAQKVVSADDPEVIILPHAMGASISGVITSAIFAAIFISLLGLRA